MTGRRLGAVIMILGVVFLAACGGGNSSGGGNSTPVPTGQGAGGQQAGAGGNTIAVKAGDFQFDPTTLTIPAGTPVTIQLENDGKATHTFTIPELNIDQVLRPGEKATVQVTASQPGTLMFVCRFHQSQGMTGTLTVTGSGSSAPSSMPSPAASGSSGAGYSGY